MRISSVMYAWLAVSAVCSLRRHAATIPSEPTPSIGKAIASGEARLSAHSAAGDETRRAGRERLLAVDKEATTEDESGRELREDPADQFPDSIIYEHARAADSAAVQELLAFLLLLAVLLAAAIILPFAMPIDEEQ